MLLPLALIAVLPLAVLLADPPVSEIEPNQTRPTATPATLSSTGSITGVCRGFLDTPESTANDTRDIWRITLAANPLVVQKHTLQLTTSGTQGHTGTVVGVLATGGVADPDSMFSLQSTSINTVPARFCQVYTLGNAAPSFLYRVTGSSASSSPYTVTLTSETVSPTQLTFPCPLAAGSIKFTTVNRTTLNTKLFLFDGATLAPIPGAINDDTVLSPTSGSPQSTLVRTLAAGSYILAIANGGAVDDRPPPADDRAATQSSWSLTESPGLLVNGSSSATGSFSFTVSDMFGDREVNATKPGAYGIAFFRLTVAARCGNADLGRQGGVACHDGALDNNDLIVFINAFFQVPPNYVFTDVGTTGGVRGSDGILNNNDWIVYIDDFFNGCPG
ncbi:MAG: GC-type dockerin domain-anchored protein [Phycisphaerales bacterium]|nr:GC-type dockerin domain-anchored protein [Phycisphaerales bacterium]